MILRQLVCIFYFLICTFPILAIHADGGKFINPITDVCWSCMFPIHLGSVNVTPSHISSVIATPKQKDFVHYKTNICICGGIPPRVGIPLAFWEPVALVDVVRTPYKLMAFGEVSLSSSGVKKMGGVSHVGDSGRTSFYNVHYYNFPILHILGILTGFPCLESSDVNIPYLSELDPFWDDDKWSSVLNPEAFLFANPLAQVACIADCTTSSSGHPNDALFWCAGCAGSLYPFIGYVPHHIGSIQASYLLVNRVLGRLHSLGMMSGFEDKNFCEKTLFPRIKKSIYKTQLLHPIANTKAPCHPLGKSDIFWGSGKSFPYGGEDFVYLIWKKKHCCLDAIKIATAVSRTGAQ